jgi:hypothetical protein
MFFVAWFWAFFDTSLFPSEVIGGVWPPQDIKTFDPWDIPLLNTLILLLSGTTVTWAHHALEEGDRKSFVFDPCTKLFLSPSSKAWCAQVTVVPDNNKINVLIKGISHGSNVFISWGGQTPPITSEGNKLVSKNSQNQYSKH